MQRVYQKNNEVTEFVHEIPSLSQSIASFGEIMSIGLINLVGDPDFWNYNNPYSPLYGIDYNYLPITIIDDNTGKTQFEGILKNISIGYDIITIQVTNRFDEIMSSYLPYYYSDQDTPINIIRDIFHQYGIGYKASDFTNSNTIQAGAGLDVTVQVTPNNNITVGSLITELCKAGLCNIGFINNRARVYQYDPDEEPDATYTIDEDDLFEIQIDQVANTVYDGYRVLWSGGSIEQVGANMFTELDFSNGQIVVLWNPSGALWLGENWIGYKNSIVRTANVEMIKELNLIELGSIIEISTEKYGIDRFRVLGLNENDLSYTLQMENV